MQKHYSVKEAAGYLDISESSLYELVRRREIRHLRKPITPGSRGSIAFLQAHLDEWLDRVTVPVKLSTPMKLKHIGR
jgi:excisionase family DNA binding protein